MTGNELSDSLRGYLENARKLRADYIADYRTVLHESDDSLRNEPTGEFTITISGVKPVKADTRTGGDD